MILIGMRVHLGWPYYAGLSLALGLAVYQQMLIKDRTPALCLKAFLNNNWFGAAIFAGIVAHYLLKG